MLLSCVASPSPECAVSEHINCGVGLGFELRGIFSSEVL